jgi:hypothetical protein
MSESSQDAFDRGHLAGEIAARLAGHDQHFAAINGSLDKIAAGLASQTLADQARADAVTRVATATALKDAEEARRDKGDQSWTPFQRAFAVVAAVAAGVVIWATLFRHR